MNTPMVPKDQSNPDLIRDVGYEVLFDAVKRLHASGVKQPSMELTQKVVLRANYLLDSYDDTYWRALQELVRKDAENR